jgi:nucleoside-diphosphate-sugar epimerase
MRVLVTGATGWIARCLIDSADFRALGVIRAATRNSEAVLPAGVERACIPSLLADADLRPVVAGVDVVVHAAARVHIMHERTADPLAEFRRVNVSGTVNLARQAAAAGARRFVFLSSIKVNGEETSTGQPFVASDRPNPRDPYGISKYEAEEELTALGQSTGMEIVIIRPVLVYGPGVKANFLAMMRAVAAGIPLPFRMVRNARSLVAVDNLTNLITLCTHHPRAAGATFLVSDGEDLSTPELLRRVGTAVGRPARLIPVPVALLSAAATVAGRGAEIHRLCASLQVDIGNTRRALGWNPPITVDEGLRRAAEGIRPRGDF